MNVYLFGCIKSSCGMWDLLLWYRASRCGAWALEHVGPVTVGCELSRSAAHGIFVP